MEEYNEELRFYYNQMSLTEKAMLKSDIEDTQGFMDDVVLQL